MSMSKKEVVADKVAYKSRAVVSKDGAVYCLVSFEELDHLTGRLMQMCELNGDAEQREALKRTIKQITKDWLNNQYRDGGYDDWGNPFTDYIEANTPKI